MTIPTKEQNNKIDLLLLEGYKFDHSLLYLYMGIVLRKESDVYVFHLNGEIEHNPKVREQELVVEYL